jgi:hypothetical protein
MGETGGANIEVAHHLNEGRSHVSENPSRMHEVMEIVEAIVLALVAVTTAWSGYQAARWDGQQSLLYGQSSRLRVEAESAQLTSNQERMYDAGTVMEWLKAEARGEGSLADLFERRLLPEIRPAFAAWKATDPLHNPAAVAGPAFMPQYHNSKAEEAARLNQEANERFEEGTSARERADQYVRLTVFLATVLLLTAISQRFRSHRIRIGLVTVAFLLLLIPLCRIVLLPRA